MALPHIGSVYLTNPLRSVPTSPVVSGSATRTLGGGLVILTWEESDQTYKENKYLVDWESLDTIEDLKALWLAGGRYSSDLEGSGTTVYVTFNPVDGVANVRHVKFGTESPPSRVADSPNDHWYADLNLIIEEA